MGDPIECNNYRPISLLSNIGKLKEKLIHVRLNIFPETNNCLSENQFGFRKHHSTNDAPIATTGKIRLHLTPSFLSLYMCVEFSLIFKKLLMQ